MKVTVEIGLGEWVDRMSILRLKHIHAPAARKAAVFELLRAWEQFGLLSGATTAGEEARALMAVNAALWELEDKLRVKESKGEFDREFIKLARKVYQTNDTRAALKRKLDGGELDPKFYTV